MAMTASVPGFDTLAYARRLKEAGVAEAQAEAHAEAVRDAITEDVATKADMAALKTDTAGIKADVKAAFASLEIRLYRALMVLAGFTVAVPGAAIGLMQALG